MRQNAGSDYQELRRTGGTYCEVEGAARAGGKLGLTVRASNFEPAGGGSAPNQFD
jgi:hypothetical protein